jgi:hypothetical protein
MRKSILAAILLALVGGAPLSAAEPARRSDLDLVRSDCAGFVSVRVSGPLGKLGFKANTLPDCLAPLTKQLTLSPFAIDRVTLVYPSPANDDPLWIIETTEPLTTTTLEAIIEGNLPSANKMAVSGNIVHFSDENGRAICLTGERSLTIGKKDALLGMLKSCICKPSALPSFYEAWKEAPKHDVLFWANVKCIKEDKPAPLADLETLTGVLDFSRSISFELRGQCGNEDSVQPLRKALHGGMTLLRGQLLMISGLPDVAGFIPGLDSDRDAFRWVPWRLLREFIKGLDQADILTDGRSLSVALSVAMSARGVRTEMERSMAKWLADNGKDITTPLPFTPPAKAVLADPLIPVPGQVPETAPAVEPAPVVPADYRPSWRKVQPAEERIKLAVANVRKESALLFEMDKDGKMTFLQKVPAGEAVDIKTAPARRLIAIFSDNTAGESLDTSATTTTWLLR